MKKEKHAAISHKHEILKQTSIKLLTNGLYHQLVPGNGSELKIKVLYFDKELETGGGKGLIIGLKPYQVFYELCLQNLLLQMYIKSL